MSGFLKKVLPIALSIAAPYLAPAIGIASLGGTIALGAGLGAAGGAISGGGLKGAALGAVGGAVGGYAGYSPASLGSSATTQGLLNAPRGAVAGYQTATRAGAGVAGGTAGSVGTATSVASKLLSKPEELLLKAGNQIMSQAGSDTATKAAKIQAESIDRARAANTAAQAPYTQLGENAVNQINTIQSDPAGYVQNSPFYQSLAQDAQRRLLANQAAKGKVGSGGTAAALQEQLLALGNGLVQGQVNTLQGQVNTGANAATNVGNTNTELLTSQGAVNAAGKVGAFNAQNSGYQNQVNTMLALKGLQQSPIQYQPLNI